MKASSLVVLSCFLLSVQSRDTPTQESCDSPIYCQGSLLDKIQMAKLFPDSKTFVDMSLVYSVNETLEDFDLLLNDTGNHPTQQELLDFVHEHFDSSGELVDWTPSDHTTNPAFLSQITVPKYKEFASDLVAIWPKLARKVNTTVGDNPDRHSLIPLPNGFIVPGGRFKEIYYWDTYWIVEGLLLSEMHTTVKGILENFLALVREYGFVPNGSRVYYLNRSQPPLLTMMAANFIKITKELKWLEDNIYLLEQELNFWLDNRVVEVQKGEVTYKLAHYASRSGTPRPESYLEDKLTCSNTADKEQCYMQLKSGAESGWDFSSRWFFSESKDTLGDLSNIQTSRVIPVDLNAFLCGSFKSLGELYSLIGDKENSTKYLELAQQWQKSIEQVLYSPEDGMWFDYDREDLTLRKEFYPSNLAVLWASCYNEKEGDELGSLAEKYLQAQNITPETYVGGIPTSVIQTGEQWDLPNAWPPLQEMVILGLHNTKNIEAQKLAKSWAGTWIDANQMGWNQTNDMFEKYDATVKGQYGGGGEYQVQSGFGWTNGVVLKLINSFFSLS